MMSGPRHAWWPALTLLLLASPARAREPERPALVVAGWTGLNFGPAGIPSAQTSIFLGAAIPHAPRRAGHWIAVGLDGGFSAGLADGSLGDRIEGRSLYKFRAHAGVHGVAGPRARLMYAAGLGPLLYLGDPGVDELDNPYPPGRGLEAEGRVGVVFSRRNDARIQGVFGGQVRVGGVFHGAPAVQPLPQFGVFIAFHRAPFAPTDAPPPDPSDPPRRGLGLLIPGVVLVGVGLASATRPSSRS